MCGRPEVREVSSSSWQRLRMAAGQCSILDGAGKLRKGGAAKVKADPLLRREWPGEQPLGFSAGSSSLEASPAGCLQKYPDPNLWHLAPKDIMDETCLLLRVEGGASSKGQGAQGQGYRYH